MIRKPGCAGSARASVLLLHQRNDLLQRMHELMPRVTLPRNLVSQKSFCPGLRNRPAAVIGARYRDCRRCNRKNHLWQHLSRLDIVTAFQVHDSMKVVNNCEGTVGQKLPSLNDLRHCLTEASLRLIVGSGTGCLCVGRG